MNTTRSHLYEAPKAVKFIETERRVPGAGGQRQEESLCMGTQLQFVMMREFWRWKVGMVVQQCKCTK